MSALFAYQPSIKRALTGAWHATHNAPHGACDVNGHVTTQTAETRDRTGDSSLTLCQVATPRPLTPKMDTATEAKGAVTPKDVPPDLNDYEI